MQAGDVLVVAFDCESDGLPSGQRSVRSPLDFSTVQCTVACARSFVISRSGHARLQTAGRLTCWRDHTTAKGVDPFDPLLRLFDTADIILGYNALDFDFPLLHKHYGPRQLGRYATHRLKCLDVFARLRMHLGIWPKLNDLLSSNCLPAKTSSGDEATRMWHDNRREELEAYCMMDVDLTVRLSLRAQLYHSVYRVPAHVFGLRAAAAAVRASPRAGDALDQEELEEEFVVVPSPKPPGGLEADRRPLAGA